MQNTKIHPRFANLPHTINDSEVITSKLTGENMDEETHDINEDLAAHVQEWAKMLRQEGLTTSDSVLHTFAEFSIMCDNSELNTLKGDMINAIVSFGKYQLNQAIAPTTMLTRMDSLSDKMHAEIVTLSEISNKLAAAIPRKILKAKSKAKEPAIEVIPDNQADKSNLPLPKTQEQWTREVIAKGKQVVDDDYDMSDEPGPVKIHPSQITEARALLQEYYSSPSFTNLTINKQYEFLNYYVENILHVPYANSQFGEVYTKTFWDLIDKSRLVTLLNKARHTTVTSEDIMDAQEEYAEALNNAYIYYEGLTVTITLEREKDYYTMIIVRKVPQGVEYATGPSGLMPPVPSV